MLNRLYSYFFNKANKVRDSFVKTQQESPWRSKFASLLYLFALELMTSILKLVILMINGPYESFQLFTNQATLPVCQYSYFDHKRFQKKTRLISVAGVSSVAAATIIINLVLSLILPGQLPSYAKTVNGPWDDWAQTKLVGDPPVSSAGSLTYSPSGSAQIVGTGNDSYLASVQGSYTTTDDATLTTTGSATGGGFGNGSHSSTQYDSTNGNIKLGYTADYGTGVNGAYSCTSGTCNLAGGTYNYTTFNISAGATVNVTGATALIVKATGAVTIDGVLNSNGGNATPTAGGVAGPGGGVGGFAGVVGDGYGGCLSAVNAGGSGAGGAGSGAQGGGGGGHGASGGNGGYATNGGVSYDTDNIGGSGGGAGACGGNDSNRPNGGGGGGSIKIVSNGNISIGTSAIISANGGHATSGVDGSSGGGGGGSGGRIYLETYNTFTNSGTIRANGGNGGNATGGNGTSGGGGGAAGRVILRGASVTSGTISLVGGTGGTTATGIVGANGGGNTVSTGGTTRASSGIFTSATIDLGAKADFSRLSLSQSGSGGVIKSWGYNGNGQLGDGTTTNRTTPVTVSGISSAISVSGGTQHALALLSGGAMKAWGLNNYGQLGDGTTTNRTTPVTVSGISGAVAIAAGSCHSCNNGFGFNNSYAVLSNGTIKSWGRGDQSQLGNGTTTSSSTPVTVSGISNAIAVSASGTHVLALLADGTIKSWGDNGNGQLGDGTTTNRSTPVTVSGISNAVAIAAGVNGASVSGGYRRGFSFALLADGTIKSWGYNGNGQLGDGTTTNRSTPVTVSGITNAVAVSAGQNFAAALLADGTIKSWGANGNGQLGDGTTTSSYTPVSVSGISTAISVSAGGQNALALLSNGTIKSWGYNGQGQLGDGTTTNRSTPVTVSGVSNATTISAGGPAEANNGSYAVVGGIIPQMAANNDNATWTYKNLPIQAGVPNNIALTSALGFDSNRYIRYKSSFSTSDITQSPALDSITLNYTQYPASASVSSLKFDSLGAQSPSGNGSVKWTQIAWVTNSATAADIKIKSRLREAGTEAGLSSATWHGSKDGTSANGGSGIYFDLWGTDGYKSGDPSNADGYTACSEADGKFGDTAGANATKKTVTCTIDQNNEVLNVSGNQWLEVELVLSSDGVTSPQLDAARATYSINSNPEVCAQLDAADPTNQTCDAAVTSTTVSQSLSDANYGHIVFNTYIRDQDTADGNAAPGEDVLVALEYSDGSGNFSQSSPPSTSSYYDSGNFASNFTVTPIGSSQACTSTGYSTAWKFLCPVNSVNNNSTNPLEFAGYTIDWNAKADVARYSAAQKIRLIINDQEGINPVNISAPSTSGAFTIDTSNPTGSMIADATGRATVNNSSLAISCTDDSYNCSYSLSDDDTTFTNWQSWTGSSTSIPYSFTENASRETVVYYKIRDKYGNEVPYDSGITGKRITTGQRPINVALQDVSNVLTSPASYKNFLSWEIVNAPTNGFASYEVYRCDAPIGDTTCTTLSNYTRLASATPTGDRTINYYTDSTPSANATYYYRIATKDSSGHISNWSSSVYGIADGTQNGGEGGGGGDTIPPTISNIQIPSGNITQTAATVTWTTNSSGGDNGGVFYSTNTSYSSEKSSLSYETSHSISLTGLSSGTNYNIRIKSTDASGNQTICDGTSATSTVTNANNTTTATNSATYCPSGATYTFTTATQDTTAPVISAISTSVTSVAASVNWTTDENSDTCVAYRRSDESSYPIEQCKSESVTSHSLTLSNLTPTTTYYLKVKSRDSNNNTADSCYANSDNATVTNTNCSSATITELSFTTTAQISSGGGGGGGGGKSDFDAPRISDISVSDITASSATVIWKTNENSSSLIAHGSSADAIDSTSGQVDSVSDHKVVIKNLKPGIKYFYKVTSIDWAGNIATTDAQSFTTKKDIVSAEELGGTEEQKEKTQQVLEDLKQQIQAQGSDITDPLQTLLESVSSLIPEPIIIGEAPQVEVNTTSASVAWRTDKNSTSFVALSRDDQYDPNAIEPYKSVVGNPEDSVKEHKVSITNLLPATKYHYQVRSKALLGEMSRSKNFSFTTKSELPQIINFLQKKTDDVKTATIYWETSIPTDSVVKYTPYVKGKLEPKQSKIQGKPDMVADHEIQITGLDPGTIYQIEISGRDPFGNAVTKVLPDFTTAIDKDAPVISQVRIESAMISGKTPKIQTIISWRTDEPATGQVFFTEGAGTTEKMKSLPLDTALSTTHTAVITEFKPASIYRIKIESTDEAGNLATSRDFTILTPAQSESIIDIIVKTFENTFGWVKNIKF